MKFRYKIFLGILLVSFFISGATGSLFYFLAKKALYDAIKKELLAAAKIGSQIIPGDLLEKLTEPSQMNSTEYKTIQKLIEKIENSNDEFLYVYTMRLKGKKVSFIVDSPPSDDNNDGKITEDEMPYSIGDVYENPPKSMLLGFVTPSTDEKPIKDEMGWTMSGYSPIYDSKNNSVGLIGVDMSVKKIQEKISLIKKAGLLSLFISISLSIILSFYFSKKFIQPLNLLKQQFDKFSKGEIYKPIEINRTDEIGELFKHFNKMISELREKELLKSFLGKVMDTKVLNNIINDDIKLGGEVVNAVILFCDIKNFSLLCSKLPPSFIVSLLNEYFRTMVEIVQKWGGYVDKFIGDGLLVVFGHPLNEKENPYKSAIFAAKEMIMQCDQINNKLVLKEYSIQNNVGIHTGPVVVGLIGSTERLEYTVIGETVNIAERLEKLNRTLHTRISISKQLYELIGSLKKDFVYKDKHYIKGKEQPIEVYSI